MHFKRIHPVKRRAMYSAHFFQLSRRINKIQLESYAMEKLSTTSPLSRWNWFSVMVKFCPSMLDLDYDPFFPINVGVGIWIRRRDTHSEFVPLGFYSTTNYQLSSFMATPCSIFVHFHTYKPTKPKLSTNDNWVPQRHAWGSQSRAAWRSFCFHFLPPIVSLDICTFKLCLTVKSIVWATLSTASQNTHSIKERYKNTMRTQPPQPFTFQNDFGGKSHQLLDGPKG